jgi:hypothetical protein
MVTLGAFAPRQASAQDKPAVDKGPETVTLTAPLGDVTFPHAKHQAATECTSCHHASKTEKPLTAEHQKCSDCHTKEAVAPMTTTLRFAMHNTAEKTGTCLSCHVKEDEAGKKAPLRCPECHIKKAE